MPDDRPVTEEVPIMLRIAFAAVPEANADAAPPEPCYCVLTESTVRARWIHVHRVGSNSRLREAVLGRSRQPLRLPVETDERTFLEVARAELANEAGRFAFVARDHRGRYRGRRDFWLYRSEAERAQILRRRTPTPAEKQEAALAAAVQRCESAEQALDVERCRREDVEVAFEAERTRGEQLARALTEALAALEDTRRRIEEMADALVEAEEIMAPGPTPGKSPRSTGTKTPCMRRRRPKRRPPRRVSTSGSKSTPRCSSRCSGSLEASWTP